MRWPFSVSPVRRFAVSLLANSTQPVVAWLEAFGILILALAIGGARVDPGRPYWSAGATLAVSAMSGALALWLRRPFHVYASGLLINLAGTIIWVAAGDQSWERLVYLNVFSFALGSALWSALELWLRSRAPPVDSGWHAFAAQKEKTDARSPSGAAKAWHPVLPYSHLAVMSGLFLMCLTIALAHLAPGIGIPALETGGFAWSVLTAIIFAIIICLWDATAELVCAWLYLAGLAAILLALRNAQLSARELLWNFALSVAPYLLIVAAIAWVSPRLQNLWRAIRLPQRPEGWRQPWLVPAQLFFGIQIVALSLWMALDFDGLLHRLAGPLVVALLVPAGILMASTRWIRAVHGSPRAVRGSPRAVRGSPDPAQGASGGLPGDLRSGASAGSGDPRRALPGGGLLEYCTLALGALAAVELGWAWLDPSAHDFSWLWLHRNVMAMMALASMTVVYGVGLSRWSPTLPHPWGEGREGGWAQCGRRIGPILGVLATAVLAVILGQEAWLATGEAVPMAPEAIAVVALAMAGLATAGLCFAVLPGQDPLGLSERGRTIYVYAAELILVLIFVHLKLTIPWLFKQRIFLHYWPFILMAIAFLGVGLSEYFRRRQLRVLAEPLERTGVFLPLLPVLAYWTLREPNQYALIWFLAGLVYGLVSIFKGSWSFALFGALAANVGLWVLLQEHEVHFLKHPQFWLIPIALIGLAAEQLNRDRLTPNQSNALRYLCLIVVYVSSTADMFIAGLGNSWEMPLLLTVLSLLGMLAGMALRIRAFLYLGSSFLLLVVLTMIWHAGADLGQKWIWWASVIVLGAAMLALFGLFEKRRNDVLHVVDELKKWH
jgi:hypothetical protein